MSNVHAHILLLTGAPGVGKTTILQDLSEQLQGCDLGGFYTEEIRSRGARQGFRLVTFDGRERVLAHVDFPKTRRVGKYGVDVAALDALADETLAADRGAAAYLVDEIGKMECFSGRFVDAMRRLMDAGAPVVATVAQRGGGFIAEVKRRDDGELWEVTRANRERLALDAVHWLESRLA